MSKNQQENLVLSDREIEACFDLGVNPADLLTQPLRGSELKIHPTSYQSPLSSRNMQNLQQSWKLMSPQWTSRVAKESFESPLNQNTRSVKSVRRATFITNVDPQPPNPNKTKAK